MSPFSATSLTGSSFHRLGTKKQQKTEDPGKCLEEQPGKTDPGRHGPEVGSEESAPVRVSKCTS